MEIDDEIDINMNQHQHSIFFIFEKSQLILLGARKSKKKLVFGTPQKLSKDKTKMSLEPSPIKPIRKSKK